jgi:predicted DNA-binding protein (MmcQ/YjbR family)
MKYADLLAHCLSLPGASLSIQWGDERVFKVGGKMFAVTGALEDRPHSLSFKAGEDSFHILTQLPGIAPAPYLARAHWVMLENLRVLKDSEIKAYLARAHALVAAGLPKKVRMNLGLDA